ncbi:acetyl-CoA carboxylase biotin carboxyl carrier protein [bacterium]|nr:acetyl-CoA carboxylase biotin carboxyl carrier protein [bacterium]
MQYAIIKRLIKLVESSNINSLEIKETDFEISITKTPQTIAPTLPVTQAIHNSTAEQIQNHVPALESGKKPEQNDQVAIKSPMVGTFYSAPGQDSEPYVNTGDEIQKGTIICIIEAMKLMNEIESEVSGRITKILVANGQAVEYNQPLFMVKPIK